MIGTMKKYYQVDYNTTAKQPILDELTYGKFADMLHMGWSFVYDNVAVFVTCAKQCGVDVYQLTTESQGITESHTYLSAGELLSHGKICGKTFAELWEDLSLL